jgi:hypothetical protein
VALDLWDASAFAKRFVAEIGSQTVNTLFVAVPRGQMATTIIGYQAFLKDAGLMRSSAVSVLVASDQRLLRAAKAEGLEVLNPEPYDRLVFLHRFGPQAAIYTVCDPGRFMVLLDPATPMLTPESMGENWCLLCQDEVYVKDRVPVGSLIAVIVHPVDADAVMTECLADLRRLDIPLYDSDGQVHWQPT